MKSIEQIVDALHVEDLRNDIHPSFFDENEEYNMLIVRLPIVGDTLDVTSMGFVYTSNNCYFYNKTDQKFEAFNNLFDGPYKLIDKVLNQLLKAFMTYQDTVASMSELLYAKKNTSDYMTDWLSLKQDLVRIEYILFRTSSAMNEFIKYHEHNDLFPMNNYTDLHEHIERIKYSAGLQLSKLDDIYSFYTVRTNEKMNKMIYLLTIISAIFLPLNLVVGFFGMNTSGLPFSGGDVGTLRAIILMVVLMLTTSLIVYVWYRKVEEL